MKKVLFAFATLLTMAACNIKTATSVENKESGEIPFTVAQNYFYNNVGNPATMITDAESFAKSFGMATVMGEPLRESSCLPRTSCLRPCRSWRNAP